MDFDAAAFLAGLFDSGAVSSVAAGNLDAPARVTGWEPQDAGPQDTPSGDAKPSDTTDAGPQDAQHQDGDAAGWLERITPDGWIVERADLAGCEVVDLQPGPACGCLERWQDLADGWHCERCEPRTRATLLREHAQRLRGRYGGTVPELQARPVAVPRTWPAAVPLDILAAPVPSCSGCNRLAVVPGQPGRPFGLCFSCWSKRR